MGKKLVFLISLLITLKNNAESDEKIPAVLTTWEFKNASSKAWQVLQEGGSALDAIEQGASVCEVEQCDTTVGYGGSPDENGETTLDAMLMDGKTMNIGAVGDLRRIKSAISVARHVLDNTRHTFLAGNQATQFAKDMGFKEESLTTPESKKMWMKWHNEDHCQPNFWTAVTPDPSQSCGPYKPMKHINNYKDENVFRVDRLNHDTISMIAIDKNGDIAGGTSTNGAKHKIPGRISDSPIPGAGAYADNTVGAAAATGDGDLMMRFLPSFLAVEEMRRGASPTEAAKTAIERIRTYYPNFMGAVIALNKTGHHGAACNGIPTFPFYFSDKKSNNPTLHAVNCVRK